jgi:hypothetical protein
MMMTMTMTQKIPSLKPTQMIENQMLMRMKIEMPGLSQQLLPHALSRLQSGRLLIASI